MRGVASVGRSATTLKSVGVQGETRKIERTRELPKQVRRTTATSLCPAGRRLRSRLAHSFDDGGVGYSAALTHRLQPIPPAALLQRVDQRGDGSRPICTKAHRWTVRVPVAPSGRHCGACSSPDGQELLIHLMKTEYRSGGLDRSPTASRYRSKLSRCNRPAPELDRLTNHRRGYPPGTGGVEGTNLPFLSDRTWGW